MLSNTKQHLWLNSGSLSLIWKNTLIYKKGVYSKYFTIFCMLYTWVIWIIKYQHFSRMPSTKAEYRGVFRTLPNISLLKIPKFHLIFWCRNFVKRYSFHRVSGDSRKLLTIFAQSSKVRRRVQQNSSIAIDQRINFWKKNFKLSCYPGF